MAPEAVKKQNFRRLKYKYTYTTLDNGNVEDNLTLYVRTNIAHYYQVENIFNQVIESSKKLFGPDFECEIKINLVRKYTGQYLGHAFVRLTNPQLYYVLIGCNADGTERVEYISDPIWIKPGNMQKITKIIKDDEEFFKTVNVNSLSQENFDKICTDDTKLLEEHNYTKPEISEIMESRMDFFRKIKDENKPISWADESELIDDIQEIYLLNNQRMTKGLNIPKYKKEHKPLIDLPKFKYDEDQLNHVKTLGNTDTEGIISISPAFITPGIDEMFDDKTLYVTNVPTMNVNFMYDIFAPYAMTDHKITGGYPWYPKITTKYTEKNGIFAVVEYKHPYDAQFALLMLQKVRAQYDGQDVIMQARHDKIDINHKKNPKDIILRKHK